MQVPFWPVSSDDSTMLEPCSPPRTWAFDHMVGEHIVYVCRRGSRVLYVGLTSNLPQRLVSHRISARWREIADMIQFHPHPTRRQAAECELRTIYALRPEFQGGHELAAAEMAETTLASFEEPLFAPYVTARRVVGGVYIADHAALQVEVLFKALRSWGWPAL